MDEIRQLRLTILAKIRLLQLSIVNYRLQPMNLHLTSANLCDVSHIFNLPAGLANSERLVQNLIPLQFGHQLGGLFQFRQELVGDLSHFLQYRFRIPIHTHNGREFLA